MELIFCIVGLIFMILFIRTRIQRRHLSPIFFKTCASCCFFLMGVVGLYITKADYGFMILPGLFFGVLGDIWLALRSAYRKQRHFYLLMGMLSFALGHIFYLIGLIITFGYDVRTWQLVLRFIVACILSWLIVRSGKRLKLKYGNFKPISILYGTLLIALLLISIYLGQQRQWIQLALTRMAWASVFFLASDLLLSFIYFGRHKNTPLMITLNHLTYYAAQFLIAWSIFAM